MAFVMWRHKLMRGAVDGMERSCSVVFRGLRFGIDRLERRDEKRKLLKAAEAVRAHDRADEAGDQSVPPSDPPSIQ
jgi:hypothetical protein